jgi:hypothetical protein
MPRSLSLSLPLSRDEKRFVTTQLQWTVISSFFKGERPPQKNSDKNSGDFQFFWAYYNNSSAVEGSLL